MAHEFKIIATEETLRDTNGLLAIIADTLIDISIAICENDDGVTTDRILKVLDYRMKLTKERENDACE